jgi:hypothetical protein
MACLHTGLPDALQRAQRHDGAHQAARAAWTWSKKRRRAQDGRIKTRNPRGDEIEMRLSTLPTAFGEKMVMRIFDPDTAVKDLDALGFTPSTTPSAGSNWCKPAVRHSFW